MRLWVYLNGINGGQGKHLSLYFQLKKSHLDECLFWSFIRTIEIALFYPENKETHKESYVKPYFDTNNEIGYNEFFDHDSLHAKGFLNPNLGGGGNFTPPVGFPLITQKQ